jgi:hypothetical protein
MVQLTHSALTSLPVLLNVNREHEDYSSLVNYFYIIPQTETKVGYAFNALH